MTMQHNNDTNYQTMLTPNQLYPIVHEIPDDEEGVGFECGGSFAGLQLQGLTPFWNTLCPCELSQVVDDDTEKGESSQPEANQEEQTGHHEKKDSVVTVAMSDADGAEPATAPQRPQPPQEHPLKANTTKQSVPPCANKARRRHSQPSGSTDRSNQKSHLEKSKNISPKPSPSRRKLHIRRGSKQLMNKLFSGARSNNSHQEDSSYSMSSTKDLSVMTDTSTAEESHLQLFPEDAHFKDFYIMTQQVYQRSNFEIWDCLHRHSGKRFSVKVFDDPTQETLQELNLFHNLSHERHPNLARLIDVFMEPSRIYMVMEEVGESLFSKVIRDGPFLNENDVKLITRALLDACQLMHSKNIVHGALKPENILMSRDPTKRPVCTITEFGDAVDLKSQEAFGTHGTCGYSAPEVLEQREAYNTQADMWSIGCLVYFMLTGNSPFEENPAARRQNTIKALRAEYSFPMSHFQHVSRSAKQFICGLIITDPSVRMTVAEALEHPWLRMEQEKPQSSGIISVCRDQPLFDSGLMGVGSRHSPATNSPARKSAKKHRRKSSLSSLFKIFQQKEHSSEFEQHPLKKQHRGSEPDLCPSSTFASSDSSFQHPSIASANSWTAQRSEKKSGRRHRRRVSA